MKKIINGESTISINNANHCTGIIVYFNNKFVGIVCYNLGAYFISHYTGNKLSNLEYKAAQAPTLQGLMNLFPENEFFQL